MQKTDPNRPWAGLPIEVPAKAKALFDMAVDSVVGNGESILFWTDRWLNGSTMAELAPNLLRAIPKWVVNSRTVAQALQNRSWVWGLLDGVVLQQGIHDQFRQKLNQSGVYRSKSA